MNLEEIRLEIDRIDSEIIGLLSKRSVLVRKAGKLKKNEQAVRDPGRVEKVIDKVRRKAVKKGLEPDIAEKIYRHIIDCFIKKEMIEFERRVLQREAP